MPSYDHCCVPLCTNRRDRRKDLSFHTFPPSDVLKRRWIHAIRRDEGPTFQVSANTVVCSEHFLPSDYASRFSSHTDGEPDSKRRYRRLSPGAVPSRFSFVPTSATPPRPSRQERLQMSAERAEEMHRRANLPRFGPMTEKESLRMDLKSTMGRITELEELVAQLRAENDLLESQVYRFENVKKDDKQLRFCTGLSSTMWTNLWDFLQPSPANMLSSRSAATESQGRQRSVGAGVRSALSLEDQLLLVLMRLRLGRLEMDLAFQFGISQPTVCRILTMWINFLYLRLGLIPIWPCWEEVESIMPEVFKKTYPSTFAIIDATELRCEVPSSLSLQSQHFSSYKSHTTMKGLVSIAPNGSFTFISELYSGAISDQQLVVESGFLDLLSSLPEGKSLMADRGFEIQDLLVESGTILNIPPFKGPSSLSEAAVTETQKIARLRIHVERAIGQVKGRFHVFDHDIPLSLAGSVNQMWTVCCLLCNFFGPLVSVTE